MRRFVSVILGVAAVAAAFAAPAGAQERFAVVIGAENYPASIGVAAGARDDARHVADALTAERFEVELIEDPDEAALKRSVFWLVDNLNGAGPDAVGVFYFAGQGVQINADTFLLPLDARTNDDLTLSGSALAGEQISQQLDAVANATTLIVIDAASPNALTQRFDLEPGLASIDRPDNGLVIFSHYPDQVALPRQGGVSVFARAFANMVHSEERDFGNALQALRREVSDESGGSRYAWVSGRLSSRFTLSYRDDDAASAPAAGTRSLAAPPPTPMAAEAEAAEQIHYVDVFFGTDRRVEPDGSSYEFTSDTARTLTYGVATVSIPPKHVAGQLESPRWWRFEFSPNPDRHVVFQAAALRDEGAFFSEVRDVVQQSTQKQAFVFVHGFNTTFEDAARRTAQMHHDLAFDGAPIFYSWPSEASASPLAYAHDTNAADRTVPRLQEFLMKVADETGAEEIHLIAHSMGNRALVNALDEIAEDLYREGRDAPFNQIVLSAPDIDRDVFLDVADQILPTADRLTLYASSNDQALQMSRQYNGNARAGDASDGIVIVNGLNTIDASQVKTELFDIGHDYFATDSSILTDIRELIETNADPDDRGLEERLLPPEQNEYWVILRSMFSGD